MEKIAASEPINAIAGRVLRSGVHFTPGHKEHLGFFRSETRPPIKTWKEATGVDLTGTRFGRMIVIGYSAQKSGRWVVKCDCGWYELRKAKSVVNPQNANDMCMDCRQTFYITHGYGYNNR